jgi:hypothetical protein
LPNEAQNPHKEKDKSSPVQLVMDNLMFRINLENESIVYLIVPEDLDIYTSCHNDKNYYQCENVSLNPRAEFFPRVIFFANLRKHYKKCKEDQLYQNCTSKKAHNHSVDCPNLIVLCVQYFPSVSF